MKYLFEHFEIDHLLHLWTSDEKNFREYRLKDLNAHYLRTYPDANLIPFHNACFCALRFVCELVKWPEHFLRSEDTEFNMAVYENALIRHKVVLFSDFIAYRVALSTAGSL